MGAKILTSASAPLRAGDAVTGLPIYADPASPPAWMTNEKLRWAAPVLVDPLIVMVKTGFMGNGTTSLPAGTKDTRDGSTFSAVPAAGFPLDRDIVYVMPGRTSPVAYGGVANPQTGVRTGDFGIDGGRNIWMIGGDHGVGRYKFPSFTGVCHVEGVKNSPGANKDACNYGGSIIPSGVFRQQNCISTGVNGSGAGTHADCGQAEGYMRGIQRHRCDFDSNYQIFRENEFGVGFMDMSFINGFHNATPNASGNPAQLYVLLTGSADSKNEQPFPLRITEVYGTVRSDLVFADKAMLPTTTQASDITVNGATYSVQPSLSADGAAVVLAPIMQATDIYGAQGVIRNGSGLTLAFAKGVPGVGYVSPGT